MQWWITGCCALSLMVLTGCPETYRRGGRADRAAHKDMKEAMESDGCSRDEYDLYCEGREESEKCLEKCG
jgi:hypothetical protein